MERIRFCVALCLAVILLGVCVSAHAVDTRLAPVTNPPARAKIPTQQEFFALLDYQHFPALASVQSAVQSQNYNAAKIALLDYMRNRKTKWQLSMPSYTPPTYFFDAKNDWDIIRAQLMESSDLAVIKGNAQGFMAHNFTDGSICCWQEANISWLPYYADCAQTPDCNVTYVGIRQYLNKWQWVGYVNTAYLATRDFTYSNYLINQIMVDYALEMDLYDGVTPAYADYIWQAHETNSRVPTLLESYFLTLDATSMTPQANYEILRLIFAHGEYLALQIDLHGAYAGDEDANFVANSVSLGVLFPEFLGGTIGSKTFRGSRTWLKKGLQWLEANLVDGGWAPNNVEIPPTLGESGWQNFFATNYHTGNARQLTGAFQLLDRNNTLDSPLPSDAGTTPLVSNTQWFQLSHGPLSESLPSRARGMIEVLYQNAAPDDQTMPNGDGKAGDAKHVLSLGVVTYGDPRWKARSSTPAWQTTGADGRGKFEGVVADDAGYASFRQAGSDFMMMHSDSVNRVYGDPPGSTIDSQFLFFDGNDAGWLEHAQEDICQVQYFSHGQPMLIDPTGISYSEFQVNAAYHSVSIPNTLAYGYSGTSQGQRAILPGASVHDFASGHGMTVAKASLTTVPSSNTIVETRTVVFFPNEYAIVADVYPPGEGTSLPATTYWHIGSRATNPGNSPCTAGDGLPNATLLPGTKSARAQYYNSPNGYCKWHQASLYILPLHPTEITASLADGFDKVGNGNTPTKRVLYAFDARTNPSREQVLFPQYASDLAIVPTLTALDPDGEAPGNREKASGFDLVFGTRRDITLINNVTSSYREFGGQFATDANVAHLRYASGNLARVTLKDGSFIESAAAASNIVESATGPLADLDVILNSTEMELYASPNARTVSVLAPSVTQVFYNGSPHAFTKSGNYVTVNMAAHASTLAIDPGDAIYAWENSVFDVDVTANDAGGVIASDFNEAVALVVSPSTIEMSLDNFRTTIPNGSLVTLIKGYAHIYLRGSQATTTSPASLTATYSGAYGNVTPAVKNDIYIDSLATRPYTPSTTSTSTTTTTIPLRENIFYDNFEDIDAASGDPVFKPEWSNPNDDVQLWATSSGNGGWGERMVRFNNSDTLELMLPLTCRYKDVKVQWSRMTKQRNSTHTFKLSWYDGATWMLLENVIGNSAWQTKVFTLPSSASYCWPFKLKIETNTGSLALGFVDEVYVTGLPGGPN